MALMALLTDQRPETASQEVIGVRVATEQNLSVRALRRKLFKGLVSRSREGTAIN
jgi:hypothetical protein